MFASLSGVLLAPTIGLDASILTLLVVQAFGAAAFGLFTSLPLAYVGGLVLGVGQAFCSRYANNIDFLRGLGTNLPFVLLFAVLVFAPRRRLVDIAPEHRRPLHDRRHLGPAGSVAVPVLGITALVLVPHVVGPRLLVYEAGLAYVIIFLSMVLLDRLSGQLSLAQLAFSAVGGTAAAHFAAAFGLPWLLAVLCGAFVAVPVGAVLAIPAIRLSGLYLALASFGFSLLMEGLFYGQRYMFGDSGGGITTPRPSFARGDRAYYYVLLAFALAASALLVAVRRAPLGRLLRAMADSPVALSTHGMNVTAIKVIAFCLSSFLAGLGGALLGPVTGSLGSRSLTTLASLGLVVVLMLQFLLPDVPAAFGAAFVAQVLPAYLVSHPTLNEYLPVIYGASAILIAVAQAKAGQDRSIARGAPTTGRAGRSPVRARLEAA
jgi:ABC-type branched-subunit amino acid transport system permease subunit